MLETNISSTDYIHWVVPGQVQGYIGVEVESASKKYGGKEKREKKNNAARRSNPVTGTGDAHHPSSSRLRQP